MSSNIFFLLSSIFASTSQIILKYSANKSINRFRSVIKSMLDWKVILSYFLLFCSLSFNMLGLRTGTLIMAVTINSLSFVLVYIASVVFFKESIRLKKILAYTCIVAGIIIGAVI